MSVRCESCVEAFPVDAVGAHIKERHLGVLRDVWTCECKFEAPSLNEIAGHCLRSGHAAGKISRLETALAREKAALKTLVRLQEGFVPGLEAPDSPNMSLDQSSLAAQEADESMEETEDGIKAPLDYSTASVRSISDSGRKLSGNFRFTAASDRRIEALECVKCPNIRIKAPKNLLMAAMVKHVASERHGWAPESLYSCDSCPSLLRSITVATRHVTNVHHKQARWYFDGDALEVWAEIRESFAKELLRFPKMKDPVNTLNNRKRAAPDPPFA